MDAPGVAHMRPAIATVPSPADRSLPPGTGERNAIANAPASASSPRICGTADGTMEARRCASFDFQRLRNGNLPVAATFRRASASTQNDARRHIHPINVGRTPPSAGQPVCWSALTILCAPVRGQVPLPTLAAGGGAGRHERHQGNAPARYAICINSIPTHERPRPILGLIRVVETDGEACRIATGSTSRPNTGNGRQHHDHGRDPAGRRAAPAAVYHHCEIIECQEQSVPRRVDTLISKVIGISAAPLPQKASAQ